MLWSSDQPEHVIDGKEEYRDCFDEFKKRSVLGLDLIEGHSERSYQVDDQSERADDVVSLVQLAVCDAH